MTLALTSTDTTCCEAPATCSPSSCARAGHPSHGGAQAAFTKTQLIEAILELNATASRDWLMSFDFPDLRGYWLRLQHACSPRGSAWCGG